MYVCSNFQMLYYIMILLKFSHFNFFFSFQCCPICKFVSATLFVQLNAVVLIFKGTLVLE